MAINFPNSPTNGQTTTVGTSTYTWNSSAGTWDLTTTTVVGPTGPAAFYVQATTPSTTVTGSYWVNTTDGRVYAWDGTEWFEPYNNLLGQTGTQGPSGVINVTAPITNSGSTTTATLSVDQAYLLTLNFLTMGG